MPLYFFLFSGVYLNTPKCLILLFPFKCVYVNLPLSSRVLLYSPYDVLNIQINYLLMNKSLSSYHFKFTSLNALLNHCVIRWVKITLFQTAPGIISNRYHDLIRVSQRIKHFLRPVMESLYPQQVVT